MFLQGSLGLEFSPFSAPYFVAGYGLIGGKERVFKPARTLYLAMAGTPFGEGWFSRALGKEVDSSHSRSIISSRNETSHILPGLGPSPQSHKPRFSSSAFIRPPALSPPHPPNGQRIASIRSATPGREKKPGSPPANARNSAALEDKDRQQNHGMQSFREPLIMADIHTAAGNKTLAIVAGSATMYMQSMRIPGSWRGRRN